MSKLAYYTRKKIPFFAYQFSNIDWKSVDLKSQTGSCCLRLDKHDLPYSSFVDGEWQRVVKKDHQVSLRTLAALCMSLKKSNHKHVTLYLDPLPAPDREEILKALEPFKDFIEEVHL